jgi:hypothetical protein
MIADGSHRTWIKPGEDHHWAKLNDCQVVEIRRMHSTKEYTHVELGRIFNISKYSINLIVNNKTWKHLL